MQGCTSSKVTEIEEHLSSRSPLPDVVDHFQRMSEPDVWRPSAEVYGERRREGRPGRGSVKSTHVVPLDISLGNLINSLSRP